MAAAAHCGSENGCGSGKMSQMFCAKPRQFRVRNGIGAHVGEEVRSAVAEGALLRSALMYALPLALLFAGAMSGRALGGGTSGDDAERPWAAVVGLLAGFVLAEAYRTSRRAARLPRSPPSPVADDGPASAIL